MGDEKKLLPKGLFFSLVMGSLMPINGLILSKIIGYMTKYFILL